MTVSQALSAINIYPRTGCKPLRMFDFPVEVILVVKIISTTRVVCIAQNFNKRSSTLSFTLPGTSELYSLEFILLERTSMILVAIDSAAC